jgi:hypothetical protein
VCSGQLCLSKRCSFLSCHESYVRSVGKYCFVRNYAAIPVHIIIIIIITIIFLITSLQGTHHYIPETNHVSTACSVAAVLYLHYITRNLSFDFLF